MDGGRGEGWYKGKGKSSHIAFLIGDYRNVSLCVALKLC